MIMFADRTLLEGMAAPVTLVSWRPHRVKRVVASASAAEAMDLSEAISQGDWVRALWSGMVLGPEIARMARTKRSAASYMPVAIIREDLSRPQMFLRWVGGKALVADALTKLHGDGDLLRAVCRQAFTVLVEAPEIMAARRQERRRT